MNGGKSMSMFCYPSLSFLWVDCLDVTFLLFPRFENLTTVLVVLKKSRFQPMN